MTWGIYGLVESLGCTVWLTFWLARELTKIKVPMKMEMSDFRVLVFKWYTPLICYRKLECERCWCILININYIFILLIEFYQNKFGEYHFEI